MRKALVVLLILGVIVLGLLGWVRGQYNGLVAADEAVKTGWSQVENQLQRRYDLIPNLVETVKGYASHERETLQAVTDARSRVGGAGTVDEKIAANQQL
ncbi:MAG: LemA family protein, partial [Candidatus Eisenbacteria bacterium]|nr:LemA family protein [Candidatus Eisenbacteria bacterium]